MELASALCSTPPESFLGGVAATTPDAPMRKRPAAALAKILLNSAEDIYQSFMEDLRTKYVSLAAGDSKRERHVQDGANDGIDEEEKMLMVSDLINGRRWWDLEPIEARISGADKYNFEDSTASEEF